MDATSESKSHTRPFKPIFVARCHRQTATDRFGPEAPGIIRDNEVMSPGGGALSEASSIISGSSSQTSLWQGTGRMHARPDVPVCQAHRNNLTALSQVHNLYFCAYQGQIYIYRPRTAVRNGLPRTPDLRLSSKPTYAASVVGGYVDPYRPHSINHIITGLLGQQEVVVASFDDGDVVAYYTEVLESYIRDDGRQNMGIPTQPRPFFHDNVGISAWGLAVHSKSRLIAVSSNLKEVTVFAFAMHRRRNAANDDKAGGEETAEARVRRRRGNWRIIVAFGESCSNIPNICFMDDSRGYADKVCAIDIDGSLWTTDIWKSKQPVTRIHPTMGYPFVSEEYFPTAPKGWGLVALPERSFMKVNTMSELVGYDFPENPDRKWLYGKLMGHNGSAPLLDCAEGFEEADTDNPCPVQSSYFRQVQMANFDRLRERAGMFDTLPFLHQTWAPISFFADLLQAEQEFSLEPPGNMAMGADELGVFGNAVLDDDDDDDDDDLDLVDLEGNDPVDLPPLTAMPATAWHPVNEAHALAVEEDADEDYFHGYDMFSMYNVLGGPMVPEPDEPADLSAVGPDMEQRTTMIYRPHSGVITPAPVTNSERKVFINKTQMWPSYNRIVGTGAADRADMGAPGYRIMRSYEKEIDLQPSWLPSEGMGSQEIRVVASNILTCNQLRASEMDICRLFRTTSRMSMVAEIPELYLVIFASPTGRVVVVTPTRLATRKHLLSSYSCSTGFRIECVLPRASDEKKYRPELRPLHGMAVGPIQQDGGKMGNRGLASAWPKRYRLMLHYRNHDILSYEISRDAETQRIGIF